MTQHANSPLNLGIAGFGTVGYGLVRILLESKDIVAARTGREVRIHTVLVRDAKKDRGIALPEYTKLTTNPDDLINAPEIDVVVELMGGIDGPKALIEKALNAGKHVVTANKALLAETGNSLFALAAEKNLHLGYEASVCGGIPIIQTLREGLVANQVEALFGILNGTSNYILSEMSTKGLAFDVALKKAQELGFAEADPTLDIEGFDAAHKLALLIRIAWGLEYPYAKLPVQGITAVQPEDITYARQFGYRIKLLGQARMINGRIQAGVFPTLVHESFLMARVGGAYNAVRVEGDAVGPVFLHGKGAGDMPTGSAVAADIFAIARNAAPNNTGFAQPTLPCMAEILPPEEVEAHYYIRLSLLDNPGVLRDIASVMADNGISIAQAIQKDRPSRESETDSEEDMSVPFIFMTHRASAKGIDNALTTLVSQKLVEKEPISYRVLGRSRS